MLLTNTDSWTYSKRQVCQGVYIMLVFITEPLWVKAFRVRVVLGVTVQPNDGNKEGFSWLYFHRRVRFQYIRSNTHSINSCNWWVESEGFCKFNKHLVLLKNTKVVLRDGVHMFHRNVLYFESVIPYHGTHVNVVWFMPIRKVCPSLCQIKWSSQLVTALCSGLLYKIHPKQTTNVEVQILIHLCHKQNMAFTAPFFNKLKTSD